MYCCELWGEEEVERSMGAKKKTMTQDKIVIEHATYRSFVQIVLQPFTDLFLEQLEA